MTIYLLVGESGEYSSWREWFVRAYTSERKAQDEKRRLNNLAKIGVEKSYDTEGWGRWFDAKEAAKERLAAVDPQAKAAFGACGYSVHEIELVGTV